MAHCDPFGLGIGAALGAQGRTLAERPKPSLSQAVCSVWADASLIEPIAWLDSGAARAGLVEVPPSAYWAGLMLRFAYWFSSSHRAERWRAWRHRYRLAPLGTHLLLLVSWWGFFRWVNDLSPWPFVCRCGPSSRSRRLVRAHAYVHVPLRDMLTRAPAALFSSLLWLTVLRMGPWWAAFALRSLMAFGRQPPSPHLADDPSSAATNRAAGAMLER